jgi:uncharacterized membrane protein HdeD (DUF308 family)
VTVSDAHSFDSSSFEPLRAKRGWIVALGVIYLLAGIVALSSVALATVVSVFIVGIAMLVAGVAEVINAFQMKSWSKFLLWVLLGSLYIAAGILAFENPLLTAKALTLLLSLFLLASGITKIILAFSMKVGGSWLVFLSGLITAIVGAVILAHWPVESLYVLGIFLGVDLVVTGAGWISIGLGLKNRV